MLLHLPGIVVASDGDEHYYGEVLSAGWQLTLGYGTMQVMDSQSGGRATSLALSKGARVIDADGQYWDFDAGLSYTKTREHPQSAAGDDVSIGQAEIFTQSRRLSGETGWFFGWHLGMARLTQSPADTPSQRDLQPSLGILAGWLTQSGVIVQLDAITTSPSPDISLPEYLRIEYETLQYRGSLGIRF